jgi:hypothetical protein
MPEAERTADYELSESQDVLKHGEAPEASQGSRVISL